MPLIILVLIAFFSSLSVKAEQTTIIADAEEMIRDRKSQTLELKGNVNVIFQQQHLLCDEAIVYEETSTIVAKGHVVLQNARTTLRGERIEFNYDTNKGKIFGGVVTSGQVLIEADIIEKVGEDQYVADDAYYTACMTCPPSWGFTSSNVEAEMGGYAHISRPWLHILQVPVLPLPYLVVPLNSKRQTGFLVPTPFTNPEGGFAIEQPFFWAIDRSHDVTFSLINYEKRGVQGTADYRYVINETSNGQLRTGYLRDRTVQDENFRDRWFVDYAHRYDLPDDFTQRTKFSIASDRRYSFDFFQQFLYNGEAALENSASLTKTFENSLLTLESSYYLSQIEPERGFRNDNSRNRLPEINFEMNDVKVSDDLNLYFNFDAQYLNVMKRGLPFEHARTGSECDTFLVDDNGNITSTPFPNESVCYPTELSTGEFVYGDPNDPRGYGDLILTGQRLDLRPSFHAPFWVGDVLDVDPSVGVRLTQYALGVESDESQGYDAYPTRFYGELGLNVKSDLNRVYEWSEDSRIKHSIVPEINLRYIPDVFQSDHNFFGDPEPFRYFRELQAVDDTDADWRNGGRGIQFDHHDRIIGKQFVDFAITNKILRRNLKNTSSRGNRYVRSLYFRVSQALDIHELRRGSDARAWQSLNTTTAFSVGSVTQTLNTFYYPYHNRTSINANTRFNVTGGSFLGLGYNRDYNFLSDPPVDDAARREFLTVSMGLRLPYFYIFGGTSFDLNTDRDSEINDPFQSWRIAMQITPPGSCWTINAELIKALNNPAIQPSINMEFKFSE